MNAARQCVASAGQDRRENNHCNQSKHRAEKFGSRGLQRITAVGRRAANRALAMRNGLIILPLRAARCMGTPADACQRNCHVRMPWRRITRTTARPESAGILCKRVRVRACRARSEKGQDDRASASMQPPAPCHVPFVSASVFTIMFASLPNFPLVDNFPL